MKWTWEEEGKKGGRDRGKEGGKKGVKEGVYSLQRCSCSWVQCRGFKKKKTNSLHLVKKGGRTQ